MTALILNNAPIFWLTLGGLLLAAEMIGVSGYLLWSGIAAILTGLLTWLLPIGWAWQGIDFALLTVIAALFWTRWLKRQKRSGHDNGLNQRVRQLTGQHYRLEQALENGQGYVRIGDSRWPVQADSDLPAGSLVEVTAVEGITLQVRRVNS